VLEADGEAIRMAPPFSGIPTQHVVIVEEDSRRPQPDEMRAIFARLGLGGDFWDPQSDSFG
jgi:hypothetical protein